MGRQSFTLKQTAIGGDVLLEIPRNHLAQTKIISERFKSLLGNFYRDYLRDQGFNIITLTLDNTVLNLKLSKRAF